MGAKGSAKLVTKPCYVCMVPFTRLQHRNANYCSHICWSKRPQHLDTREERLVKRRSWRLDNAEKLRDIAKLPQNIEKQEAWKKRNVERVRAYKKIHAKINKDKLNECKKRYSMTDRGKEAYLEWSKKYRAIPRNRMSILVSGARSRATKSGIEFDPSILAMLQANPPMFCACCGLKFDYTAREGRRENTPSLDRRDNSRGYTCDNTFVICFGCNGLKSDATVRDIENILAYMRGENAEWEGAA